MVFASRQVIDHWSSCIHCRLIRVRIELIFGNLNLFFWILLQTVFLIFQTAGINWDGRPISGSPFKTNAADTACSRSVSLAEMTAYHVQRQAAMAMQSCAAAPSLPDAYGWSTAMNLAASQCDFKQQHPSPTLTPFAAETFWRAAMNAGVCRPPQFYPPFVVNFQNCII